MPVESPAKRRQRATEIVWRLKERYPGAKCSLNYRTVHQLMVATILSAQCTDERVNAVTPTLFRKYRSIRAFADANLAELGKDVYSTGFHNSKAKAIKKSAQQLLERYSGKMPKELDKLTELSGVGRKTGSVILGAGFGLAEGIVVDTHVTRISRLLKLAYAKDAVKIEKELMKILHRGDWIVFSHLMIEHGRATCIARRPHCPECILSDLCPSAKL